MLEDGLSYPAEGESWLVRVVIGAVLTALSILIIPIFFLQGYFVRVLASTARGEEIPPEWDDWGELGINGLKAMVIGIVYGLVPFIILNVIGFVLVGLVGLAGSAAGDSGGGLVAGLGLVTIFVYFIIQMIALLIVLYLIPGALINFAAEDSLGAAFDFSTLKRLWLSSEYLVAMLLPLVIAFIIQVVNFILGITVIGLLLVPLVAFWGNMAIFRMFGLAYVQVMGTSSGGRGRGQGRRQQETANY